MASTLAVLSIVRRTYCGHEFRWPAGKLPYFITPRGVEVIIIVVDYVPHLRTQLSKRTVSAITKLFGKHMVVDAQNPNTKYGIYQLPVANPSRVKASSALAVDPVDEKVCLIHL